MVSVLAVSKNLDGNVWSSEEIQSNERRVEVVVNKAKADGHFLLSVLDRERIYYPEISS